ncbi:hypothetical protein AX16_001201 [Volvariella volvacea WC 439]|nr:hypothetical protein AX16_001201 [Volvariella volvacea WC 439]
MGGHHTNGPAAVAPPAEPRLPQELERVVFEMAARDDMRGRVLLRLMSVARRAREWLQPLLYETIILGDADFYHKSNSPLHRPPRFPTGAQRAHVRNLFVSDLSHRAKTEPHWPDLLPHCPNLEHLVFWFEFIPSETALDLVTASLRSPLRSPSSSPGLLRLIAPLASLFPDGRVDFHHEIFRHLTHLGVFDFSSKGGIRWEEGNNYRCIPRLRCLYIVGVSEAGGARHLLGGHR